MFSKKSMEKELLERTQKHKRTTIETVFQLLCIKIYGEKWDKGDKIHNLVCHIERNYPEMFEALYQKYWEFTSKMLNEDGTATDIAHNWRNLI